MNLIEFSIACKLIGSKLKNVEVPKMLPPTLLASLQHIGTPIRTPTGAMSPTEGYKQFLTQQPAAPLVQQQPLIMQAQPQQPVMVAPIPQQMIPQQMVMAQVPQQMIVQPQPILAQQQIIPTAVITQQQQSIMTNSIIPNSTVIPQVQPIGIAPPQPQIPLQQQQQPQTLLLEQLNSGSLLDSLAQAPVAAVLGPIPGAPTPPSGSASRSMSFSEKVPSVPESP
jgi:hypothetical protein